MVFALGEAAVINQKVIEDIISSQQTPKMSMTQCVENYEEFHHRVIKEEFDKYIDQRLSEKNN